MNIEEQTFKRDQMAQLFVNNEYDKREEEDTTNKILSSINLNKADIKTSFGSFSAL